MSSNPRVIIVGAGFAGLAAAKRLLRERDVDVLVLDRRNHHLFQPLLYQVATAGLNPGDIAAPIRAILSGHPNLEVRCERVTGVDPATRIVRTEDAEYAYDFLVLATGAHHAYFGHDEWEEHAPGLKTLEEATEIRRRILGAFERAERVDDEAERRRLQTFVVVGAGPTGVELAGAIAELARFTLSPEYRRVDPARTRVILVEAQDRILGAFAEPLSERAMRDLGTLGVNVRTETLVTQVTEHGVHLGDEFLPSATVLWAAGVQASPLGRSLGVELDRQGRVPVGADLSVEGRPEIFVAGDLARCLDDDGEPLPAVAPVAMLQGRFLGAAIVRELRGKPRGTFRYRDRGQMATIGRRRAIVQKDPIRFGGTPAWWAWLFVHIYQLTGFRNRLIVFLQWAWSYLTFRRGVRVITERDWRTVGRDDSPRS